MAPQSLRLSRGLMPSSRRTSLPPFHYALACPDGSAKSPVPSGLVDLFIRYSADFVNAMPAVASSAVQRGEPFGLGEIVCRVGVGEGIRSEEHTSELQSRPHL